MSSIDPQGFPLDLTGELPRNLVIDDTRTLATQDDTVFVPDGGPFYTRTLVVRSGTTILKPNVDYKCLHLMRDASIESGLDVSSVVMITNTSISQVTLSYQVIGGQYGDTVPVIRQLLENADNIEKSISWNTHIYAKPDVFEPAPHFVSGEDFSDWSSVLNGIQAIERSILLKDVAAWESAFQYIDNLILNRVGSINLTNFYTKSEVNAEVVKLALKTSVYTKVESDTRHYSKAEVQALIGDIDGNETYYTEAEVNAKFIEGTVADAKFSTKAELNRVDSTKADSASVYTRVQADDKYALKIDMYHKDYIDATFVIKGTSYNKVESDARYALSTDAYNKVDSDKRYALKSQIPTTPDLSSFITRADADFSYLKINTADIVYLRKTTADSLYAKHTDLEVIVTLTKKFLGYYTKVETDELFITNATVNSLFLTKVQGNSLYFSKTFVASTYATKKELSDESVVLNNAIALKSDTAWVNNTFYTKADADKRYYTQTDSNNRYHTKQHVDSYFVTNLELSRQLALLTTLADYNLGVTAINEGLNNRYTKAESGNLYYTKSFTDLNFLTANEYNANNIVQNTLIATKANIEWVNTTFYDKAEADTRYYTKSTIDSLIYTKAESNGLFQTKAAFNTEIAKYVTSTSHTNDIAGINSRLNDKYDKSETLSSSQAISRFIPLVTPKIELSYIATNTTDGGFSLNNNHPTTTAGGSMQWNIRGDKLAMIEATIDTALNAGRTATWLFNFTTRSWSTQHIIGIEGIWHRKYGWLDSYFAVRGDTYTKAEVYSKTESDLRYMTKLELGTTYVTKVDNDIVIENVNRTLGAKADTTWVNNTFFSKVESDVRYYTKTEINTGLYTKAQSDTTFATKTSLSAEVSKLTTTLTHNADIDTVKGLFSNHYSKTEAGQRFATITTVALKSDVAWVTSNYYSKNETEARFYNKLESILEFAPKGITAAGIDDLESKYKLLLSRIEAYKVGDIYTTTNNFASSAAVANHHGYGTWERFSEGRVLIGYSPSGWVDNVVRTGSADIYYYAGIAGIGNTFGTFTHKLTVDEMPNHVHNRLTIRHGVDADIGGRDKTISGGLESSSATGGDKPHSNIQPVTVVGMWRRIA